MNQPLCSSIKSNCRVISSTDLFSNKNNRKENSKHLNKSVVPVLFLNKQHKHLSVLARNKRFWSNSFHETVGIQLKVQNKLMRLQLNNGVSSCLAQVGKVICSKANSNFAVLLVKRHFFWVNNNQLSILLNWKGNPKTYSGFIIREKLIEVCLFLKRILLVAVFGFRSGSLSDLPRLLQTLVSKGCFPKLVFAAETI